jgi:hypothetical protein
LALCLFNQAIITSYLLSSFEKVKTSERKHTHHLFIWLRET